MQARNAATTDHAMPHPLGVGFGVALDWGLTVELLGLALITVVMARHGQRAVGEGNGLFPAPLVVAGDLVGALLTTGLGEGLRAGRRWAWLAQVILTGGLSLYGVIRIPQTITALAQGDGWSLVSQIILVTTCPLICYRLLQPPSRAWFASVTVADARARHSAPRWLATIIACAIIGGALVVIELYS